MPQTKVYVFARDPKQQEFARGLGATWAGHTEERAPELLDAIIDTTPVWRPVVEALKNLRPGGRLVINAIRKEEADKDCLLNLSYQQHLWYEKEIKSVANITHDDIADFLPIAAQVPLRPSVSTFPMEEANQVLQSLRRGGLRGAQVLIM